MVFWATMRCGLMSVAMTFSWMCGREMLEAPPGTRLSWLFYKLSKVHIYGTVCHPTLIYGMDSLNSNNKCIKQLESTQGCIIKQVCGLNKRAHHSSLLRALEVEPVKTGIDKSTILLYNRLCVVDSPTRNLYMFMLRKYVSHNKLIPGSILQRIVNMTISPITAMFGIHS